MKREFVIKLTNNNLEAFDSEKNRRKLAQKNVKVVQNFNEEEDSMIIARRVPKLFRLYTEREFMEEIKKEKQINVKRSGISIESLSPMQEPRRCRRTNMR